MNIFEKLIIHLNDLEDPRVLGRTHHKLIDVIVIGVCAVICSATSWYEMEDFGEAREEWLRKYLELPNGIPSHDTFARIFSIVDPKQLELCFMSWVQETRRHVEDDTIVLDGKVSRGTVKSYMGNRKDCLNTVSAWSTASGIVLGQIRANGTGYSEIPAAKELIDLLDIKNLTVIADAGIGRESMVKKVREKKGNYLFPVKGNSTGFITKVDDLFAAVEESDSKYVDRFSSKSEGHGRKEKRTTTIIKKALFPKDFNQNKDGSEKWKDLFVVGRIVYESSQKETRPANARAPGENSSVRTKKTERRYFISNLDGEAEFFAEKIRQQWAIESQLHYVLDVTLGEDDNRTRNKVAAQNLATARKIALNLVKKDETEKGSLKVKMKRAGWRLDYLEKVLFRTQLA